MNLDRVPAGKDVPNDCNVIIEIPMRGDPIKYEVDKETGAVFVDRFMSTAMHYPCNYGYIPRTLSDDGDPVRRAGALAGAAHHRRGRALPPDRHAEDGRRGGRRRARSSRCRSTSCRALYRTSSRRATCRRSRRSRSRTSSSTTRTSSPASGCASSTWVGAEEAKREIIDGIARYQARDPKPTVLSAMPTAAHARRQLAFPVPVRAAVEHRLHRGEVRAAVRAAAHLPALPFALVAALMARRRVATRRGLAASARRGRARRRCRPGSCTASTSAACCPRSPAACRPASAAMLVGLQPILTVLLARGWLGERVVPRQWLGLALGLAGVWLVVRHKVELDRRQRRAHRDRARARRDQRRHALPEAILLPRRSAQRRRHPVRRLRARVPAARAPVRARAGPLDAASSSFALGWAVVVLSVGAISLLYWLLRHGAASNVAGLFFLVPAGDRRHGVARCSARALDALAVAGMVLISVGVALARQTKDPATAVTIRVPAIRSCRNWRSGSTRGQR